MRLGAVYNKIGLHWLNVVFLVEVGFVYFVTLCCHIPMPLIIAWGVSCYYDIKDLNAKCVLTSRKNQNQLLPAGSFRVRSPAVGPSTTEALHHSRPGERTENRFLRSAVTSFYNVCFPIILSSDQHVILTRPSLLGKIATMTSATLFRDPYHRS